MNNLEKRITKLEQKSSPVDSGATIVVVYEGTDETEAELAKQKAIGEYQADHPDCDPSNISFIIWTADLRAKDLLAHVADRTSSLK